MGFRERLGVEGVEDGISRWSVYMRTEISSQCGAFENNETLHEKLHKGVWSLHDSTCTGRFFF